MPGTRRIRSVALTVGRFAVVAYGWNCPPERVVVVSAVVAAMAVVNVVVEAEEEEEEAHPVVAREAAEGSILMIGVTSAEVEDIMLAIVPSPAGAKAARDLAAVALGLVRASCVLVRRATAAVAAVTGIANVPAVPVPRLRRKRPDPSVR